MNLFSNLFTSTTDSKLSQAMKDGAFLVDVRTLSEYAAGKVHGSVNIPLNTIASKLDSFKDKKTIVVFCRSGNRSSQARSILLQSGINNVLDGGSFGNVEKIVNSI